MENLQKELMRIGLELGEVVLVPDYECGVQAGLPTDSGNEASGEMFIPKDLFCNGPMFTVTVHGESMRDFDFREGDRLLVSYQPTAMSGDIVIAMVNGASTVKTYFEDENGSVWLIPGNESFSPIELRREDDNRIIGVVKQVVHESPRMSYRECSLAIRNVRKEKERVIGETDIARALKAALTTMNARGMKGSRPWFAVYRAFTDRSVVQKGDYSGFVSLVESIMGEESPKLNVKDMRSCMDVMSFEKPVALWSVDYAPVSNKRFYDYLEVAKATSKALMGMP